MSRGVGVGGDAEGFKGRGDVGVFDPCGFVGDVLVVEDQADLPGVERPCLAGCFAWEAVDNKV